MKLTLVTLLRQGRNSRSVEVSYLAGLAADARIRRARIRPETWPTRPPGFGGGDLAVPMPRRPRPADAEMAASSR
ncbi:hypothetical protein Acor_15030 [Acrocarpospora corrugata]|uniref:Uncharacterized protein n=1 Tax=Acrocarpospora corrugata TaxID=35763 RepID=A0A5M3VU62_9ACTN|nr:hypothetical protein [Acrocarpospora corrugata]GER99439.1 hypothetical protein Acor_15030 [Acrocarpospora corrugata]